MESKYIVIGGGIAGLSLAHHLPPEETLILEKQNHNTAQGAGLLLGINAVAQLQKMGLLQRVMKSACRIQHMLICDHTGRQLSCIDNEALANKTGLPTLGIHRADMHAILLQSLPHTRVLYAQQTTHLERSSHHVLVRTSDQVYQGSILVGADGLHSVVRRQFFPAPLRYSGYTCWRGVVEHPQIASQATLTELWGRGKRFGIVPVNQHQVYFFATTNAAEACQDYQSLRISDFRKLFAEFGGQVPDILDALNDDATLIHNDLYDRPEIDFGADNILLAGDAAHAMTPNLGQGAAQALEDAAILGPLLATNNAQYQMIYRQARFRRAQQLLRQSWQIGRLAQWQQPWLCLLRNQLLRWTPDTMTNNNMEKLLQTAHS